MRVPSALLLGVLLAAPPLAAEEAAIPPSGKPNAVSDRNLIDGGKQILFDVRDVVTAPGSWDGNDWLKFGLGAGAVVATGLALDRPIREASQRSRTPGRDDEATTIQRFGQEYSWAVMGGFAVAGWAFDDAKSRRVVIDALAASLIAGGVFTTTLKYTVGRYRPGETTATWQAQPFSGHVSFPSGHTTQAFALAAVVSGHYRQPWVRVTAFFVAGCVGLARIHLDQHYASDVLASALIGTSVGGTVVALNEKRRGDPETRRVTVTPLLLPRGGGLQVAAAF